jgi:hypothetical protein
MTSHDNCLEEGVREQMRLNDGLVLFLRKEEKC